MTTITVTATDTAVARILRPSRHPDATPLLGRAVIQPPEPSPSPWQSTGHRDASRQPHVTASTIVARIVRPLRHPGATPLLGRAVIQPREPSPHPWQSTGHRDAKQPHVTRDFDFLSPCSDQIVATHGRRLHEHRFSNARARAKAKGSGTNTGAVACFSCVCNASPRPAVP